MVKRMLLNTMGDRIMLVLDNNNIKESKNKILIEFWKSINGKIGTISQINGEDILVYGGNSKIERKFNVDSLKKI